RRDDDAPAPVEGGVERAIRLEAPAGEVGVVGSHDFAGESRGEDATLAVDRNRVRELVLAEAVDRDPVTDGIGRIVAEAEVAGAAGVEGLDESVEVSSLVDPAGDRDPAAGDGHAGCEAVAAGHLLDYLASAAPRGIELPVAEVAGETDAEAPLVAGREHPAVAKRRDRGGRFDPRPRLEAGDRDPALPEAGIERAGPRRLRRGRPGQRERGYRKDREPAPSHRRGEPTPPRRSARPAPTAIYSVSYRGV